MNLRHLAYFVRIADLGSFTKAAQHVRVAQPALTRHIHQLEAKFGIELFFRSSRGVVLTEAGKHLYDNATRILHDIERTSDEMRSFAGIPSGKTVLGVTPSLCPVVVPTLLSRHRRKLPGVEPWCSPHPAITSFGPPRFRIFSGSQSSIGKVPYRLD
jgi:LysR family nitrogen assimilation transcriptional regulator